MSVSQPSAYLRATGIVMSAALCLLFAAAVVVAYSGPGMVEMDYIEGDLGIVMFNHEMHTMMSDGCADCHHNHGSDNNRCSDCHEIGAEQFKSSLKDSFMACANCHGDIDPDSPEMPSLKAALHNTCFKCHLGMGNIGRSPAGCTEQCHAGSGK